MRPIDAFQYCPGCSRALPERAAEVLFIDCSFCGFRYYFNPAAAVAAFAQRADGQVLMSPRDVSPADLAFDSTRKAFEQFLDALSG